MSREKETRPSRQATRRESRSTDMVAREEAACLVMFYGFLLSIVLYGALILLHDLNII